MGGWIRIKLTRLASGSRIVGKLVEPGHKFAPFMKTMLWNRCAEEKKSGWFLAAEVALAGGLCVCGRSLAEHQHQPANYLRGQSALHLTAQWNSDQSTEQAALQAFLAGATMYNEISPAFVETSRKACV